MWFRKSHCRSIRNIAPGCGRSFSYSCLAHQKFVCFCCTVAPRTRCLFCRPVSLWGRYVICIDGSMYARALVNISSSFPLFCALGFASLWKRSCGKFVSLLFGVFFFSLCIAQCDLSEKLILFLFSVLCCRRHSIFHALKQLTAGSLESKGKFRIGFNSLFISTFSVEGQNSMVRAFDSSSGGREGRRCSKRASDKVNATKAHEKLANGKKGAWKQAELEKSFEKFTS